MPYYFNFVCDKRKDCEAAGVARENGVVQPVLFESTSETLQDAIDYVRSCGWKVEGELPDLVVLCPKHAAESE